MLKLKNSILGCHLFKKVKIQYSHGKNVKSGFKIIIYILIITKKSLIVIDRLSEISCYFQNKVQPTTNY